MPLSRIDATDVATTLREQSTADGGEAGRLQLIRQYVRNEQALTALPSSAPLQVRQLADIARVPVLRFVVRAASQAMAVVGYRTTNPDPAAAAGELPAWDYWQRNRLDARQIGVHKAAVQYGAAYVTVLPGEPVPVIRGVSPRMMTARYGDDADWPVYALQRMRSGYRLLDAEAIYTFTAAPDRGRLVLAGIDVHPAGVCPVVRFRDTEDLDDPVQGIVEPHMTLADQINVTTFGLLVAQHFGAFRQRAIIGWLAESETELLKATAHSVWTFADAPEDVKLHEFSQTDPSGYLKSRESALQLLATVSQTPVHELLGQLVNLSAEALAAARDSHNRAVSETQIVCGEAWEQTLELAGVVDNGDPVDPMAYVKWADLEARSLASAADALGKLVQMLGVPPQELWERVPGVTMQEVERWKAAAGGADVFDRLAAELTRQAETAAGDQTAG